MSFSAISRGRWDGQQCGRVISNYAVTLPPEDLSSIVFVGNNARASLPFNYVDLNRKCISGEGCYAEVSLPAYLRQPGCIGILGYNTDCFTIRDNYFPGIGLPTQLTSITSLAPEWGSSCVVEPVFGAW